MILIWATISKLWPLYSLNPVNLFFFANVYLLELPDQGSLENPSQPWLSPFLGPPWVSWPLSCLSRLRRCRFASLYRRGKSVSRSGASCTGLRTALWIFRCCFQLPESDVGQWNHACSEMYQLYQKPTQLMHVPPKTKLESPWGVFDFDLTIVVARLTDLLWFLNLYMLAQAENFDLGPSHIYFSSGAL